MNRIISGGLLCLIGLPLSSQTLGTITGEVLDSSGSVMPRAAVTATNSATNVARVTITTEQGLYSFPALSPGAYTVKVEAPGFRPMARELRLEVQQAARVDFKLEVGSVTAAVEVTGTPAMLASENATVGTVIDNRRMVDLPLNGRNFLQLVALSANVSYGVGASGAAGRVGGARTNQNMAIAGMRTVWNNYTLDGIPNNDPNINSYELLPSVEFLQEFKVQSGIYPAEFGRAATQINVSTKSGSNDFHGSAYEFVRNNKFDAKDYAFTPSQAAQARNPNNPFQWNQYGFHFGGPVWIPKIFNGKNRLFFNSNYEFFRQVTRANNFYTVPSAQMRQGNFSELLPGNQLWDPVGRTLAADGQTVIATAFPGNIIPQSRLSPQSAVLWEFWPAPNRPSESATQLLRNYYRVNPARINRDQFHLRFDFVESSMSQWFGRYSTSDEVELSTGLYLNGGKVLTEPRQYLIANTRVLSPRIVNEFRFGITDHRNLSGRELAGQRDVVGELNIPGLSTPDPATWGTPRLSASIGNNLSGPGDPSDGPFVMKAANFYGSDGVSFIRGRHSFKFGGEARRDRFNQLGNEFGRGSFEFPGTITQNPNTRIGGHAAADFYLGYPTRAETAVASAFHQFRATALAFYADDTWRVSSRLTITLGLRYEWTQPWRDRAQKYVNVAFPGGYMANVVNVADLSKHPVMVRQGNGDFYEGIPLRYNNVQVARDGRLGDRLIETDNNNFAPRLGIAWSPTAKWSIRAGMGIFYSQEIGNAQFDMTRTLAGRVDKRNNTVFPTFTMGTFLGTGTSVNISTPYTWAAQSRLPMTFALNYLFNVQRELNSSTMVELGYQGSSSRRLQSLFDANAPIPSSDGTPPSTRAPFPEFGVIQTLDGNGRGSYHAGSVTLNRRMSAGLLAMGSYTWSKSIDTASGIRGQGDFQSPNDSRCLSCEKGVSGFNRPHRAVASLVYELPFGRGKQIGANWRPVLNQIAGGWQVSSILTFQSGTPANAASPNGRNSLAYVLGDRLNCTGQDWRLPGEQRTTDVWFNRSAFSLPGQGVVGNCGRNIFVGPSQQLWDASIQKSFRIAEGHRLDFRAEAFNVWNHRALGTPGTSWGSTTSTPAASFGQITSTAVPMRQLQLGLKYAF